MNKVPDFVQDPALRLELAKLNLLVSIRAKESLAFQSALTMASAAAMFLPLDAWETHQDLAYNILLELAVNNYQAKNLLEAERLFEVCLAHAK